MPNPGSAPAGGAIGISRVRPDLRQRRRPDLDRDRRDHVLRHGDPVDRLAVRRSALTCQRSWRDVRRRGQVPRHRRRAARRDRHGQRLALRDAREHVDVRGDRHRLVRSVAQREAGGVEIARAHQLRHAGEDRQVLRGAHARHAGAEQLRAVGRDRDQLERRQRIVSGTRTRARPLRVERDRPSTATPAGNSRG